MFKFGSGEGETVADEMELHFSLEPSSQFKPRS